ncbi:MAG: hypothetical protein O3A51_03615, partial [Verrucomicrobia bacterium]|nr:hypothetical protein [Verrucomicrobiota bacterium]
MTLEPQAVSFAGIAVDPEAGEPKIATIHYWLDSSEGTIWRDIKLFKDGPEFSEPVVQDAISLVFREVSTEAVAAADHSITGLPRAVAIELGLKQGDGHLTLSQLVVLPTGVR